MEKSNPGKIVRSLMALTVALLLYFFLYRPLQLNWGASEPEAHQAMPGDEIVERPVFAATRAVAIQAVPERIWPWVVQIGLNRAGWYSYDLVDNKAGRSAEKIIPRFQDLKPGDLIPISPDGKLGLWVKDLQPPAWMLWWDRGGKASWLWALVPQENGETRLITRVRMRYRFFHWYIVPQMAMDVGDFIMMRQAMLGIKARAEGEAIPSLLVASIELFLWLALFAGFVVAEIRIVRRPKWRIHLATAAVAAGSTILMVMWKPPVWIDGLAVLALFVGLSGISRLDKKQSVKPFVAAKIKDGSDHE